MFGRKKKKKQSEPEEVQKTKIDTSWHCDGTCQDHAENREPSDVATTSPEYEALAKLIQKGNATATAPEYEALAKLIRQQYFASSNTDGHSHDGSA